MTDKEKYARFEKFLKSHRAFSKYKRNITKLNAFVTYDAIRLEEGMISSAFAWNRTTEGRGYWENLNHLWVVLLETELK